MHQLYFNQFSHYLLLAAAIFPLQLKKGESMTLEWKGSDTVVATARGKVLGEMKDKDLFIGLLNVYLGPKTVSPSLRENIGVGA